MNPKLALFRQVLIDEATALRDAENQIDEDRVLKALDLLETCKGKIVVLGVGKSGLIGKKIAATMVSVGMTAIFVHAGDAMHGDLGVISSDDLVLMMSNSGETDELVALLPHLNRKRVPIVGILGQTNSTIGSHANVVISAKVDREACFLDLAPTSSTTLALAIGDALAMTIASERKLTRDDFAVNHPAGRLGKRLVLRVADLMQPAKSQPAVGVKATWRDLVIALCECRSGAVSVVSQDCTLAGLITDGDLRRAIISKSTAELDQISAESIMTPNPRTIAPNALAYDALKLMMDAGERGISILPVVNNTGLVLGMLRLQDLVRAGI